MGQGIEIKLVAFGAARDKMSPMGKSYSLAGEISVGELKQKLNAEFPGLEDLKYAVAIDKVYAGDDEIIRSGAEIAILPPVSGG